MKYQDFFQWTKNVNMLNAYCDRAYERAKNIVNYKEAVVPFPRFMMNSLEKVKTSLQKIKNRPRKNQ